MEQILQNMANYLLIEYCRTQHIDCAGTICVKDGRGFSYILRATKDARGTIARITFHKNQVPTYGWN